MTSIYNQLSEAEMKLEQRTPVLLPTEQLYAPPKLKGIKAGVVFSWILGLGAILGVLYVYYVLQFEIQQRGALESSNY